MTKTMQTLTRLLLKTLKILKLVVIFKIFLLFYLLLNLIILYKYIYFKNLYIILLLSHVSRHCQYFINKKFTTRV